MEIKRNLLFIKNGWKWNVNYIFIYFFPAFLAVGGCAGTAYGCCPDGTQAEGPKLGCEHGK